MTPFGRSEVSMKPSRRALLVVCTLAAAILTGPAPHAAPANPLIAILQSELTRNLDVLRKQPEPPYFIGYTVTDSRMTSIAASFGALTRSAEGHSRTLTTEVRVGDYELDSTHQVRGGMSSSRYSHSPLPLGDDEAAIRAVLWRTTDRRYKDAVEALARVKTNIATKVKEESAADDFSREEPQVSIGQPASYTLDTKEWEQRLRRVTAPFADDPQMYLADAQLSVSADNRYYVTSEGTQLLVGDAACRLAIQVLTKAADGMELPFYVTYHATTPAGLPRDPQLLADVQTLMKQAAALRNAPTVEPFAGPAILSGRAAAVFFHEIFGHRIEGHRQKNVDESQTFAKKIGQPILPAFLSVIFDPTVEKFGNQELAGHYLFDDEGVKAQRVTVVDKGVLKTFLMSRSPVPGFARSNGHGRAQTGNAPVSRQSNLFVESSSTMPYERLLERLRTEIKTQGKPFGLLFENIEGGFTFTGRMIPNAFTVIPTVVYRVYADARPPELVRGVDLIGTPLAAFSKIVATSDKAEVFNGICGAESGGVPVSAISPALLVSEVEVQKKAHSQETPPILPAPERKKTS
jgi:predicted Zn-dependent protease